MGSARAEMILDDLALDAVVAARPNTSIPVTIYPSYIASLALP
jgi:hypothetical protein